MIALLTALAGGLGAVTRFRVDSLVSRWSGGRVAGLGTVVVNVTGAFALGLVTGWSLHLGGELAAVLGTGFLGGYTTFSTASVEAARLLRGGRVTTAVLHAGGMLLAGVAAAGFGLILTAG